MSEEHDKPAELDTHQDSPVENAAGAAGPTEIEQIVSGSEPDMIELDQPAAEASESDRFVPGSADPDPVDEAASSAPAENRERLRSAGNWLARTPFFRSRRRTVITLAVIVPLLACLSCWLVGFVALADTAKLVEIRGLVHTRPDDVTQWDPASLNQLVGSLHWVRTGASSGARLVFFDVSTADLEEETEVRLDQIRRRRGGDGIDVVINILFGNAAIRAVRFVDPSSTFRVDTPAASTMVRGARFSVQVGEDGETQIDLEEGSAEVRIGDEVVELGMGQRITLQTDGLYTTEQLFEPNAQLLLDRVRAAWQSPGSDFDLELTDTEINHFLTAMSEQQVTFLRDTQLWFVDGEARIATTLTEPAELDVSAAVGIDIVNGEVNLDFRAASAGLALPVPRAVLNLALNGLFDRVEAYSSLMDDYLEFSEIEIGDGVIRIVGQKVPGAQTD